ncbi:MAG: hypothetical protein P9M03_09010 [Candidatus Theseobacter exili]|nr:hypothetical protein [Candidatus Theseobacter exili]
MQEKAVLKNKYGLFSPNGEEYVIVRPDTPRPWVNVISNGRYGLTISQTGGGFSWLDHSNFNRLTRWDQDMIRDNWGKYVYIRDEETNEYWSLTWKPTCPDFDFYECRHGMGYTRLSGEKNEILGRLTVFVPPEETCEVWLLNLENRGKKTRKLSLITYFEWLLGVWPDNHRELQKLFTETRYDSDNNAILATKLNWGIFNEDHEWWNTNYPFTAFHSCSLKPVGFECDKENFLGMYGNFNQPKSLKEGKLNCGQGRYYDPVASLHVKLTLKPGETKPVVFTLGISDTEAGANKMISHYSKPSQAEKALNATKKMWKTKLAGATVHSPDDAFNILTNHWLKYQAVSGRLFGRCGYYQSSGAYGFRDQLQDSLMFLSMNPGDTRERILIHASHQFQDGTVHHWWHPITEVGEKSNFSDDLLWLPYVVECYIKETLDYAVLDEVQPFLDGGEATVFEHCARAIRKSLSRRSPRGLPLIGTGDWNDGLSSAGDRWKGETVWVGHFLYEVICNFVPVCRTIGKEQFADEIESEAVKLREAVNEHGWNGEYYWRASLDNGEVVGTISHGVKRVFLNAQTWSIISGVADKKRSETVKKLCEEYLYREYGPVLFYPALSFSRREIGYLSRYAPATRENGGLYTHAACWAIMAECIMGDGNMAYDIYSKMNPIRRGKNPDLYKCEPYVTPGNVDGPESDHYGRGGWTWYTGSAAWLYRVSTEWIMGIRPEYKGLLIDPCIPSEWESFYITRKFRGDVYHIEVLNPNGVSKGISKIELDGRKLESNVIKPIGDGKEHEVRVIMG